ncbi:hypothetical protein [Psychromonas sp. Urea-02u-13]|uniref:hypothetical protein n=1 Tax=Psychromonas sp. Urea-02u-13 TaxID=2058326 RepID=UPI000C32DF07|nr:hypothetical protein [Psychromonas sp. Urea-02u-13]PKG37336.1 hypothetical protein CXF74_19400 [Psychromonas sp. Urea-02u-13]
MTIFLIILAGALALVASLYVARNWKSYEGYLMFILLNVSYVIMLGLYLFVPVNTVNGIVIIEPLAIILFPIINIFVFWYFSKNKIEPNH